MAPKKKDEKKEEAEAPPLDEVTTLIFEAQGGKYHGTIQRRDGVARRNGSGTYTDAHITYDGQWKDDIMQGEGTLTFTDGSSYTGAFLDGQFTGQGKYKWPSGAVYSGLWRFNRMHGEGVYTDTSGQEWRGKFYNGTGPGLR